MEVKKGEWYYWTKCPHCTERVALFHDTSKGRGKLDFISVKGGTKDCPKCGGKIECLMPELFDSQEAL